VTNVALGILPIQPGKCVGRYILLNCHSWFFKNCKSGLNSQLRLYTFIALAFCTEWTYVCSVPDRFMYSTSVIWN
jgi:hypothetical protein